jgi:hypothetical protein
MTRLEKSIQDETTKFSAKKNILQGVELPGDIDFLFYSRNPLFFRGEFCCLILNRCILLVVKTSHRLLRVRSGPAEDRHDRVCV